MDESVENTHIKSNRSEDNSNLDLGVEFLGGINDFKVPWYYGGKYILAGNTAEFSCCSSLSHAVGARRINKNQYEHNGETLEYTKKSENRKDNMKNVMRSIRNCKYLIDANFLGEKNELFITLTYRDNMKDRKKLYNDKKNFYKKLKEMFPNQELLYIDVAEPQKRGAWHLHILLKNLSWTSTDHQWFLSNDFIRDCWYNKGFVSVKALQNVDEVGNYVSTYLTNLKDGKKNSRLHLYPKGFRIYNHSKNVVKPVVSKGNLNIFVEKLKDYWEQKNIPKPYSERTSYIRTPEGFDLAIARIKIHKKKMSGTTFNVNDYLDSGRQLSVDFMNTDEYKQLSKKPPVFSKFKNKFKPNKSPAPCY